MTKKSAKTKLTDDLKSQIRTEFVQGYDDQEGIRKHYTIEELIKKYNVASATLYRHAREEGWKALREQFESELLEQLNQQRQKTMAQKGKKFDDDFLARASRIIEQVDQYFYLNARGLDPKHGDTDPLSPQHFMALCTALTTAQKLSKIALGEVTENINVTSTVKEAESFRRVMDVLHRAKRERLQSSDSSLH